MLVKALASDLRPTGTQTRANARQPVRRELAVFGAVYLLYDAARWIFAGKLTTAQHNARWVIHLEHTLHISVEASVQRALGFGVTGTVLSYVYLTAQLLVLPGALIWLYRHAPEVYRPLRNTVVGMWLISVPVFALYPVAPPRLAGIGIKDTVSHHAGFALTGHSTLFYNPYAAVPSLHVGLAFAIGIAFSVALRRRWAKLLALGWGPLVTLAVVATGNHYIFDAATGIFVAAFSYVTLATAVPARMAQRGRAWIGARRSTQELDHARTQPDVDPRPIRVGGDAQRRSGAHPLSRSRRPAARPALSRRPGNRPDRAFGERLIGRRGPERRPYCQP